MNYAPCLQLPSIAIDLGLRTEFTITIGYCVGFWFWSRNWGLSVTPNVSTFHDSGLGTPSQASSAPYILHRHVHIAVITMSGRSQTGQKRRLDPVKKAECFAVAAGHQIGIFFNREDMLRCTKTFPERLVLSCATVNEAEAFLLQHDLVPIIASNGWLSTKKAPILYQRITPDEPCVQVTPTPLKVGNKPLPDNVIASDSAPTTTPRRSQSPQSLITIHSSLKEKQETPLKPSVVSNPPSKKFKGPIQVDVIEILSDSDDAEQQEYSKSTPPGNDVDFDTVQQQAIDAGKMEIWEIVSSRLKSIKSHFSKSS
jgi:hypothetical protein